MRLSRTGTVPFRPVSFLQQVVAHMLLQNIGRQMLQQLITPEHITRALSCNRLAEVHDSAAISVYSLFATWDSLDK